MSAADRVQFHYHGSDRQKKRLEQELDHCQETDAKVYKLAEIVHDGVAVVNETTLTTSEPHQEGSFIYAVRGGEIRVAPDGRRGSRGAAKHETLFNNLAVDIAGDMQFLDGVVAQVTDESGSYGCMGALKLYTEARSALLTALKNSRIKISDRVVGTLG